MEGRKGFITLKLPYPVVVEEISIDHVSPDIVLDEFHHTAPKTIKIIGYPACEVDDEECVSLGFDKNSPIDIAQFTYDMEGPTVQTFGSYYGMAAKEMATKKSEVEDPASCSTEAASCTAPPRTSVVGVTVKILENWGDSDFTCIYRVRIHGEAEI